MLRSAARIFGACAGLAVLFVAPTAAGTDTETFSLKPALSTADRHTATTDFQASGTAVTISGVVTQRYGQSSSATNWDAFYYDGGSGNWSPNALGGVNFGVVGDPHTGPFVPPYGKVPPFNPSHTYTFTSTLYEHHLYFWAVPFGKPMAGATYTGGFTIALTPSTPPGGPVAVSNVKSVRGEVTVVHADGTREPLTAGTGLRRSDSIETGVDADLVVTFPDGVTMKINEMTQLLVADIAEKKSRQAITVDLKLGEEAAKLNPKKDFQTDFNLRLPNQWPASVRGSAMKVFYDPGTRTGIVATLADVAFVGPRRAGGKRIRIPAGKEVELRPSGISPLAPIGKANAHGGIDRAKAFELVMALVDRSAASCGLHRPTGPPAGLLSVKPAAAGWLVNLTVAGTVNGVSTWSAAGAKVSATNALARRIAAGCR